MRDLPHVPERVAHHRAPIAVRRVERRLERRRAGRERARIRGVRVVDVDVQERREAVARFGGRHHDERSPIRISAGRPAW